MSWFIFQLLLPFLVYFAGLQFIQRRWRKRLREAWSETFAAERGQQALMWRLMIHNAHCEVCFGPFNDEQMAVLRIGPGDPFGVLAHGLCLPPLPDEPAN